MKQIRQALASALAAVPLLAGAATFNPSASKAYVDGLFSGLRAELRENGVFTNTLQNVYNVYTNTYQTNVTVELNVSYTTNVLVGVNTTTNVYMSNIYTNTYQTNVTVAVNASTNFYTTVNSVTNLNVYVTNSVFVVTNDIPFADAVWYTNGAFSVYGYTGTVIRATAYDEYERPTAFATNDVRLAPRAEVANCYTNETYMLLLVSALDAYGRRGDRYALLDRTDSQRYFAPYDELETLGIRTSYKGTSLAEATELTLVFASGMAQDTALFLFRADVDTQQRESLVVNYSPKIAAKFADEARRLVSDDGRQWLDSTGVWWEVSEKYALPVYNLVLPGSSPAVQVLLPKVATGGLQNEAARYENGSWRITYQLADGNEYVTGYYTLTNVAAQSGGPYETFVSEDAEEPVVTFWDAQAGANTYAYLTTAYTNGVVRTNAVRRVVFDDGASQSGALSAFDALSVSTNTASELEIAGFAKANQGEMPIKSGSRILWTVPTDLSRLVAQNTAWGFSNNALYNCFVQIGRDVEALGIGTESQIPVIGLSDGAYCVKYDPKTNETYRLEFKMLGDVGADAYKVYVGTLSTDSGGARKWAGIGSIPIILVFD